MLDVKQHEYLLKRILRDILFEPELSSGLIFKGGTCLYLFYGLNRFSVDLDFDFRGKMFDPSKMTKVLDKHLKIDGDGFKGGKFGWLWEGSYEKGYRKMQVDVSSRQFDDSYQVEQFYGLSIKTLTPDSLFAHKLCAVLNRKKFQNRDLYDVWFMLDKDFPVNEEIVKVRMNKDLKTYLQEVIGHIKAKVNTNRMLDGLGELLDEKGKYWVKNYLLDELLALLEMKVSSL
jgi:predicted nucleotidyltransferase component of viral defense system